MGYIAALLFAAFFGLLYASTQGLIPLKPVADLGAFLILVPLAVIIVSVFLDDGQAKRR